MVDEVIYLVGVVVFLEIFLFMKYFFLEVYKCIRYNIDFREKLFLLKFEERKKIYKEGIICDIIDVFIKVLSDVEIEDFKVKGILDDIYLKNILIDFIVVGLDIIMFFLMWVFFYLVVFLEV